MYGGKSFNGISVKETTHEWHNKYLTRRKEHIYDCLTHLISTDISNKDEIMKIYVSLFGAREFIEILYTVDLPKHRRIAVLGQILERHIQYSYNAILITLVRKIDLSEENKQDILDWIEHTTKISDHQKHYILEDIRKQK